MDETLKLIELAHQGDKAARDRLVTDNMGLIWSIVKRFAGRGYEQEDLFQIGSRLLIGRKHAVIEGGKLSRCLSGLLVNGRVRLLLKKHHNHAHGIAAARQAAHDGHKSKHVFPLVIDRQADEKDHHRDQKQNKGDERTADLL